MSGLDQDILWTQQFPQCDLRCSPEEGTADLFRCSAPAATPNPDLGSQVRASWCQSLVQSFQSSCLPLTCASHGSEGTSAPPDCWPPDWLHYLALSLPDSRLQPSASSPRNACLQASSLNYSFVENEPLATGMKRRSSLGCFHTTVLG